jgi:PAS domain S-box-containing protein
MNTIETPRYFKNEHQLNGIIVFENAGNSSSHLQDYSVQNVSEEVAVLFNLEVDKLKGKRIIQLIPALDAELQELFSGIVSSNYNQEVEFFHPNTDKWYKVVTQQFENQLLVAFSDISDYKTIDTSLESFFEFNLEMFSIFNKEGKCIRVNNEWENVLGYSFDELQGYSYVELIHPDDLKFTLEMVSNFENNQKIFDFTNRLKTKDGSYKYIEWRSCFVNGLLYSSSRDITDVKEREDEIENQDNLRQIVEHLDGVFYLVNADMSKLLYITPNYPDIFGIGKFEGADYLSFVKKIIHRDDLKHFNESMYNYTLTGKFNEEYRVWKSRKEYIWVYASVFKVYNKNGELIRHAGFIQDITNRKKTELAEKESRKRLDVIIKTIPDVLITYNSKGEYLNLIASHQKTRIFKDTDVAGKHISDYFPPHITDLFMKSIKVCLETHSMQTIVFDFEKNGKKRYFENRFSPIDNEKVLSVVRDSTDLVLTDRRLRFQLELQQILLRISNALLGAGKEELETITNNAIAELGKWLDGDRFYIFSYNKEDNTISNTHEWCSEGITPLISKMQQVSLDTFGDFVALHMSGQLQILQDVRSLTDNEPLRAMLEELGVKSMVAIPLMNNDEYLGFIGLSYIKKYKVFHEDEFQLIRIFAQNLVSKREILNNQAELQSTLIKAKESDRLKSTFLATLSHELRTPLNHIIGFSELLQDLHDDATTKDYLSEIYKSGQHLKTMIEDMFMLAFSTDVTLPVRKDAVKGVEIYMSAKASLSEFMTLFGKDNVLRLQFELPNELMNETFVIDKQKTLQILTKLFSNAVKFTNKGQVSVAMYREGSNLKFTVRDTGIGISPDNLQIIFDAFRQLDDDYSRNYEGLGIGLSIAKKTAESIGATLTLESKEGEGTCFYLSVPSGF